MFAMKNTRAFQCKFMKAAKNHMTDLLSLYKKYFNLGDAIFTRIAHNDAIVAIVYKIIPAEQGPLILKISERAQDYFREVYFLENLVNKLPVPSIIGTFEPKDNIPGAILMKCLWGDVLKIDSLTEPVAYQIGLLLAQIHLNRAAGYGDLIPADNLKSKPHAYFMDKFEESFRDLADELGIVHREIFQLIRVAWSGQLVTPPMLETMLIMGEDEVIKRVNGAIEFLNQK